MHRDRSRTIPKRRPRKPTRARRPARPRLQRTRLCSIQRRPPWPCPRSNLSLPHPCGRVRPHNNLDQQSGWCLLSSRHPHQAHNLRPRRSLALSNRGLSRARGEQNGGSLSSKLLEPSIILNRPRRAPRATAAIFRPAQALTARSAQPTAPISRSTVGRDGSAKNLLDSGWRASGSNRTAAGGAEIRSRVTWTARPRDIGWSTRTMTQSILTLPLRQAASPVARDLHALLQGR
jgi:hypothetical protein